MNDPDYNELAKRYGVELPEEETEQGISSPSAPMKWRGTRNDVDALLNSSHGQTVRKFFEAIQREEGGQPDLIVGGQKRFDPRGDHPNIVGLTTPEGNSTAAGNYQITGSNWYGRNGRPGLKQRLRAKSFDPENQLRAAVLLFGDRDGGKGIQALINGDLETATKIAAKDWAALPGSNLHKGRNRQKSLASFLKSVGVGGENASNVNFDALAERYLGGPDFDALESNYLAETPESIPQPGTSGKPVANL
ncbi:MAG: hypothetical protein KDB79_16560, partial [Acidobacteria bacterium]|nr:hypothetical protein [Acidobacteriota bacterium]